MDDDDDDGEVDDDGRNKERECEEVPPICKLHTYKYTYVRIKIRYTCKIYCREIQRLLMSRKNDM